MFISSASMVELQEMDRATARKYDIPAYFHLFYKSWEMMMGVIRMKKPIDYWLKGQRQFGDYTVLGDCVSDNQKERMVLCRCACGTEKPVSIQKLIIGRSKRCKECAAKHPDRITNKKHGQSYTKEYTTWSGIKSRCTCPTDMHYSQYGGAGIGMCAEWLDSFETFYRDMGDAPTKAHSIDRIDNSKGYSKENCRWATAEQQSANRDCTILVEYRGETVQLSQLARKFGMLTGTVNVRLKNGWDIERALRTPPENRHPLHLVDGEYIDASEMARRVGRQRQIINYWLRKGYTAQEVMEILA